MSKQVIPLPKPTVFNAEQHFLSKWEKVEGGCLVFTGYHNEEGYGIACYNGRQPIASRLRWEILTGEPIPEDRFIFRTCGRKDCGELSHFELLPFSEIVRRNNALHWGEQEDRFQKCFHRDKGTGCLIWYLKTFSTFIDGRSIRPHHYAYEQYYETKLSDDEVLRARCGRTDCIEPTHRERISRSEHARRVNASRWGEQDARWQKRFHRDPKTGCLVGPVRFEVEGVRLNAAHYAYEQYYAVELSSDDVLHSTCGRKGCIEPTHRERMTMSESARRAQLRRWEKWKNYVATQGT